MDSMLMHCLDQVTKLTIDYKHLAQNQWSDGFSLRETAIENLQLVNIYHFDQHFQQFCGDMLPLRLKNLQLEVRVIKKFFCNKRFFSFDLPSIHIGLGAGFLDDLPIALVKLDIRYRLGMMRYTTRSQEFFY